jgi:type III restriction enzyme
VQGMGFEALAAATAVMPDPGVPSLFDAAELAQPPRPPVLTLVFPAAAAQALSDDPDVRVQLPAGPDDSALVSIEGEVSDATLARLVAPLDKAARADVAAQVERHNALSTAARAPALRGVAFAPLPMLCVSLADGSGQGEPQLFERETLSEIVTFDLLRADPRPELPGLRFVEQSDLFEIYMNNARVEFRRAQDAAQLVLDHVPTQASEQELVAWLATTLRRPGSTDAELMAWSARLVGKLLGQDGVSLTAALRARQTLAQAAARRLDDLDARARKSGFEQLTLLADRPTAMPWTVGLSPDWSFRYQPGQYPARNIYSGRFRFEKHYYEVIHALKSEGEEFECAKALDRMEAVKHWVRNVEQQERLSFWLPTATDYFYPDFVAELNDGRLFVVEYKGEAYATNDDSREKRAVGHAWAKASQGKAVFVMVEREVGGLDIAAQLERAIAMR